MVSTAAFHARVRGSVPGLGGLKETKMFLPHPRVKVSVLGLRPPGLEFRILCLEDSVISIISPSQEVLLAQFSLYVHKGGLKPDSFHLHLMRSVTFILTSAYIRGLVKLKIIRKSEKNSDWPDITNPSPYPFFYFFKKTCTTKKHKKHAKNHKD